MSPSEHTTDFVMELDQRRIAAMLTNDADQLGPLIDTDLVYIHSSGVKDSRDDYLALISQGNLVYHTCDPTYGGIISLGPTAFLVTGQMHMDIDWYGRAIPLDNLFIAAWKQGDDDQWRLISWQSTPLPKPDSAAH